MNRKRCSAIRIKEYPWRTSFIETEGDLGDALADVPYIAKFARNIHLYEKYLWVNYNSLSISTRHYLCQEESLVPLHGDTIPNSFSLVTAFRLLEIVAQLAGKCAPKESPTLGSAPPPGFQAKFLKECGANLKDIRVLLEAFRSAAEVKTEPLLPTANHLVDHLLQMNAASSLLHITKIEKNIVAAASGLAIHNLYNPIDGFKAEGSAREVRCPELCCKLEILFEQSLVPSDVFLQVCKKINVRLPLSISAHVSPLVLLLPIDWSSSWRSYPHGHFFELANVLGGHNIPLLLRIEEEIWRTIIDVSSGAMCREAITGLVARLPWGDIEQISQTHPANRHFTIPTPAAAVLHDTPETQVQSMQFRRTDDDFGGALVGPYIGGRAALREGLNSPRSWMNLAYMPTATTPAIPQAVQQTSGQQAQESTGFASEAPASRHGTVPPTSPGPVGGPPAAFTPVGRAPAVPEGLALSPEEGTAAASTSDGETALSVTQVPMDGGLGGAVAMTSTGAAAPTKPVVQAKSSEGGAPSAESSEGGGPPTVKSTAPVITTAGAATVAKTSGGAVAATSTGTTVPTKPVVQAKSSEGGAPSAESSEGGGPPTAKSTAPAIPTAGAATLAKASAGSAARPPKQPKTPHALGSYLAKPQRETRSMTGSLPIKETQPDSEVANPSQRNSRLTSKKPPTRHLGTFTAESKPTEEANQRIKTARTLFKDSADIVAVDRQLNLNAGIQTVDAGQPWRFINLQGNEHRIAPLFHSEAVFELWTQIHQLVEKSYVDGKPRYLHPSLEVASTSVFCTMTDQARRAMSTRGWQNILRKKHIIEVLERPTVTAEFDLEGLERVGTLTKPIVVHDLSEGDTGNSRHRNFTLQGMFHLRDKGRAVNALSLPSFLPLLLAGLQHAATDLRAYKDRRWSPETNLDGRDRHAPVPDLEWWLVALFGAQHEAHVDADGASTVIEVITGLKWWIVFIPPNHWQLDSPSADQDPVPFGRTRAINYDILNNIKKLIEKGWRMEAALLEPGLRLYLKSNTPHAVLTLRDSICLGAHFFSFSTLTDHFIGVVTTLADRSVTNTTHNPFRHLMRLIIQYVYHAVVHRTDALLDKSRHVMDPDNLTLEDLPDLLAAIYIGILSNAIDPLTYELPGEDERPANMAAAIAQMDQYNLNAMPVEDRAGCSLARSCSYELSNWLCHHYIITGPDGSGTKDMIDYTIAHQAAVIYAAHIAAGRSAVRPQCFHSEVIKKQLLGTFEDSDPVQKLVKTRIEGISSRTAKEQPMFVDVRNWTISKRVVAGLYTPLSKEAMSSLGVSPNDRRYLQGAKEFFSVVLGASSEQKKRKGTSKARTSSLKPRTKDQPDSEEPVSEEGDDDDEDACLIVSEDQMVESEDGDADGEDDDSEGEGGSSSSAEKGNGLGSVPRKRGAAVVEELAPVRPTKKRR